MKNILFLGPPGSGKGTQADKMTSLMSYLHLSTGNLIRKNIFEKTLVGLECQKYIDEGKLVPDNLMIKIVEDHLKTLTVNVNIIWDGFPRTIVQAQKLDALFATLNTSFSHVFYFEISEKTILARLTGRLVCPVCGTSYHLITKPPKIAGICDNDQTPLIHRADDESDKIKTRLKVYNAETKPLITYYSQKKILTTINAELDDLAVWKQIKGVIA